MNTILAYLKSIYKFIIFFILLLLLTSLFYYLEILDLNIINIINYILTLIMFYMFVVMHELSHAIVALLLKVDIKELEFTPFGVCAKYENNISDLKELIISASGPLFSIFLAYS